MRNWKYIKVFVSSTFIDMDIERDALKNIVEPHLNDCLKDYACDIEFIDLRHSVKTTNDMSMLEREKHIFNVCLEEIDNCRPYFMGIIGHRYGWIPSEDGVQCPPIDMPIGFPVEEQKLSVTMYEFLHGFFSSQVPKEQTIVFLRSEDSYIGFNENELSNYHETPDNEQYIINVREYIKNNKNIFNVVEYSLPLCSYSDKDLLAWTDLVFQEVKKLVQRELYTMVNDFDVFTITQDSYVQEHIKSFCGREKEQMECLHKIDERGNCLIVARERGLGLSSFFCKMFDDIRKDQMNICLMCCPVIEQLFATDDIISHWLYQLDMINDAAHKEGIIESKGNQNKVLSLWRELIQIAHGKGYKVFLFCESLSTDSYFKEYGLNGAIPISTCLYQDRMSFIRPMMYMLEPYDYNTVLKILINQRQEVKNAFLQKIACFRAVWLKVALNIVEKMNKADFLIIRKRQEDDNETRITQHQINLVKELPEDEDELILFWIKRLKYIFGAELMDNYLFLTSINIDGWSENMLSEIMDCDIIQITTLRQMLGTQLLEQKDKGQWGFINTDIEELLTQQLELKNFKSLVQKAYLYVGKLQQHVPAYEQMIFKLAMLCGDIEFCSEFIENHLKGESIIAWYSRKSFAWFAERYIYDFLYFISNIIAHPSNPSYQFFYNVLQWSKMLSSEDTFDVFFAIIERIISSLKSLWTEKKIDLKTYSVICDALSCKGDYYRKIGDYKKMFECIDDGVALCEDYYDKEDLFLSYYHYCVYVKSEFLYRDKNAECIWLENKFLNFERKNYFCYSENADTTVYALLLRDTARLLVETNQSKDADKLCTKSFRLMMDYLKRQEAQTAEGALSPADTRRNLLLSLFSTIRLNYQYDFMTSEHLSHICEEIFILCDKRRLLKNNDIAYEFYYRAKAAYYFIQDYDDQKLFTDLMILADDILKDCWDDADDWKRKFVIKERCQKEVESEFAAWLYVYSLAMYVACDKTDSELSFDFNNGFGEGGIALKKDKRVVFNNYLDFVLPLIGAKEFDDKGMPPYRIWDSMFILYLSMLLKELNKDTIDFQYLVELFNSASDLSRAIAGSHSVVTNVSFISSLDGLKNRINALLVNADSTRIDFHARYHNFSDWLGADGDYYSSEANGFRTK